LKHQVESILRIDKAVCHDSETVQVSFVGIDGQFIRRLLFHDYQLSCTKKESEVSTLAQMVEWLLKQETAANISG
jgi:hypothetical protein